MLEIEIAIGFVSKSDYSALVLNVAKISVEIAGFRQSLRVCHEAPFYWKLLKIGSVSVRDIRKSVPNLQVGGSAPVPPTPPIIRVVL